MKRKLFILLAAFMALATFQSNAQGVAPYDGESLFYLNVWSANLEKVHPNCFKDTYFADAATANPTVQLQHAKDYPISADPGVNVASRERQAMKYVFNRHFDRWELTNSHRPGTVGDVDSYFTLTALTGDKTNTYLIKSASPSAPYDQIFFRGKDGKEYREFTFLRFYDENDAEYDNTGSTAAVKDSVGMVPWRAKYADPQKGGYLAAHIHTGRAQGGINDRALYVVAYDTSYNDNGAPNNRYAIYSMDEVRNNWNALHRNVANTKRIVPVWVKADRVGGRWAKTEDFPDEFVQFPIQPNNTGTANYFTVGGKSVFNVAYAGALDFGAAGSDPVKRNHNPHPVAGDMAVGDNPGTTPTAETERLRHNTATNTWQLQYFTISDPCDGKVVQVVRTQVPSMGPLINGEGQFGNTLALNAWHTGTSTSFSGATVEELQRTQQFAIWINEAGNMELYPLNSWTYRTSDRAYKTTSPTSPGFNYAVWMDRPYATTQNSNVENFNNSFKIGKALDGTPNGTPCTGPVSGVHINYESLQLRPEKAILINKIEEKRYYFIQVGATRTATYHHVMGAGANNTYTANDSIYVLDLVRDGANKRVVVTAIEKNRYRSAEGRYYDTPYDSVNMSAHWRFEQVPGGYRIINELNDTLKYSYTSATAVSNTEAAYIADKNPSVGTYKSDVWQSIHLACWNTGFFKLRNMAETEFGVEKPKLAMPYLDTLANGTGVTGTRGYWYQGLRGRHAATSTVANPSNHVQKDVRLSANNFAGLRMKLTEVGYEYKPGGADNRKTNHSDDSYFPADDSLCVYLYKEGNYNLTEAISLKLNVIEGYNGPDPVWGKNLATFTTDNTSKWLYTEPVISNENPNLAAYKYLVPMTYLDAAGVRQLNVDYMLDKVQLDTVKARANTNVNEMLKSEGFNIDLYKWHYIKNNKGEYLIYDTINTTTGISSQELGFKFKVVDRVNATMFRFYQPLVGDKAAENFILEFRVAKHEYDVDRRYGTFKSVLNHAQNTYTNDNYGVNPFYSTANPTNVEFRTPNNPAFAGADTYALLRADVINAGSDMTDKTKWTPELIERYITYLNWERLVRTKYALISTGSDMLISTWNDGRNKAANAPQSATRFKFTGVDETLCQQDYLDSKWLIDNQLYANPTVKAGLMNPNIPTGNFIAAKSTANGANADHRSAAVNLLITLADTLKAPVDPTSKGRLALIGAGTAASGAIYRQYENTDEVELYYIQNAVDTTLYLTVDSNSIYVESMGVTLDGVSGMKLTWSKRYRKANAGSSVGEVSDYRPLQMFAIYGCKENSEHGYGNFIFIPAASWEYNYTAKKHTGIKANVNIGNGHVSDEFRIGSEWVGSSANLTEYMIVRPSSTGSADPVTPTEYKFTRDPYAKDDYFCGDKNDGRHSFIQAQGFLPNARVAANSNYVHSWKANGTVKNYNDPSQHWSICKVDGYDNLYTFTPESDLWDADGEKVPARNQLIGEYYLVPTRFGTVKNTFGQEETETRVYTAVPRYAPNRDGLRTLTITRISETEGDECVTAFKRFSEEDLLLDWGILESVYTDRYIYSKGTDDGSGYAPGVSADAFYAQSTSSPKTIQYLRVRESNYVTDAEHHGIPYYNIIHVVKNLETYVEEEYYLEAKENTVQFRKLTVDEARIIQNFEKFPADTMQSVKFCFPYTPNKAGDDSTTVSLNNGTPYTDINVAVRTMPYHNQIYYVAVDPNNTSRTKAAKVPEEANVFVLAPNAKSDEEWIGDAHKKGWLRDYSRSVATSIYLVEPDPISKDPQFGLLSYVGDIRNTSGIEHAKFDLEMVYNTIVNKYARTQIWYYHIKHVNAAGDTTYLTYEPLTDTTDDKYKNGDYTSAYFAGKLNSAGTNGADRDHRQTFGLLINKKDAVSPGHTYPFWIVAQVPSGKYKYLGEYNNRLAFIPTVSGNKAEAQSKAMTFELGNVDAKDDVFTGKDGIQGNNVTVVGVTGAVKVSNAEGTIELVTLDGRKINSVVATGGEQTITAPRGVVLVKVGATTTKVIVK